MTVILKSYKTVIDDKVKINNEFTRLRLHYEDLKLKIDALENELVIGNDECIILYDKFALSISEQNILVANNIRLNVAIDKLYKSIDIIEPN